VSNISHDLRTPLASIQGYVETLQLKEDILSPSERSRYLAIVFDEAAYLGHLITDLFELSKIEASHESPKREIFPISDLAQDVLQKFEPLAAKSGIRLALDVQGSRHEVFADIALMERVLSNLVDNAVRHSFIEGQVTLSVRELSNGVEVRVTDCGSGIPTQEQSRIFERFYRVPGQRGDRTMGSGLGLAIVKSILDKHEIAIQVSSAEGHGTSFFWMLERP
jgi:signal transduction histidine kinase